MGFSNESFRHCETKNFRRKNVIPLLCINFFDTPNSQKHWSDAHEIFRHCETRIFRRKNVIPPSMHKSFRRPQFSETLKGCPWNFSTLWDKNFFEGKMWYPLLSIKIFDTPNFLKHWTDAREMFRHCETKNFRRKIVIPLLCIKLFDTPNFLKHWRGAHQIFRHCETKTFRRENVIPPFSSIKLFETEYFLRNSGIL